MNVRHCDFSNAKVGDKVFCLINGEGIITNIDQTSIPLRVEFKSGRIKWFQNNGKINIDDLIPSIYYNKFDIQIPEEAYKQPLPDIAVDTPMIVWDIENRKSRGYFKCWSHSGKPITFFGGQTSFSSNGSISEWDNYEIVELTQ